MIIYVFDKRILRTPRTSSRESVTDTGMVIADQSDNIQNIVNRIITRAENERSIWLLRIICHGTPGGLVLGTGVNAGNAELFAPLAPYFTPDGRGIELHACNVASETSSLTRRFDVGRDGSLTPRDSSGTAGHGTSGVGGAFMAALASATGVNVMGGYDTQYYDEEYRWEGRGTMTVEPGGTTLTTIGEAVRP
ncbi:MAG: hypothetical protein R2747_01780 [Pyrinomonadaceae bacterium]